MSINETEIWRDYPYNRVKLTGKGQMKALLYFCLAVIALVLLIIPIVGWILEIPLLYFGIKYIRKFTDGTGKPVYILTNQRALVKLNETILQECKLANCIVSSINKSGDSLSGSSTMGGLSRTGFFGAGTVTSGKSATVGDVLFIENGTTKVKFDQVQDPDGVAGTANQLIATLRPTRPQPAQFQNSPPQKKFCGNCGAELASANTNFCQNCGNQI
jgi:hypothetical protein